MSQRDPLNPTLFSLLERRFGEGNIEIVAAGQEIAWKTGYKAAQSEVWVGNGDKPARQRREVLEPGEEYRMNCPYCKDQRGRLYVNHRWGVWDPETGTRNLWLIQCFNEHCLSDYETQENFFSLTYVNVAQSRRAKILPGRPSRPGEIQEVSPPGMLYPMDQLAKKYPGHPAVVYLEERGFDPILLGKKYDVSYCGESRFSLAANRIIVSVYRKGLLVGWQARYIGDDVNGRSFKAAGIPKYWTCPGMKTSVCPYGYDTAVQHPTVILVEGPADRWGAGPQSFSLLGKRMHELLCRRFVVDMRKHGKEAVALVMLDPNWDEKDKAKGKPHHIDRIVAALQPAFRSFGGKVLPVLLPEDSDPGSLDRDIQRQVQQEVAARHKVRLNFAKPRGVK